VNVVLVEKSKVNGMKLSLYAENLSTLESQTFPDLYTLNFHLQTLAKKHNVSKGLLIVHDVDVNKVGLALAENEDSFFID
jgi:hypothetical protein